MSYNFTAWRPTDHTTPLYNTYGALENSMQSQQTKPSYETYEGYKPHSNVPYMNDIVSSRFEDTGPSPAQNFHSTSNLSDYGQNAKLSYYEEPKRASVPLKPYKSPNPICDYLVGGGNAGDHYVTIKNTGNR